jgi:hypothetical protein
MLDGIKLYRKMRGGVWIKYFMKFNNSEPDILWIRYKNSIDAAINLMANDNKVMEIEIYNISPESIASIIHIYSIIGLIKVSELNDGYHSFDELYEHRNHLFIALLNALYYGRAYSCWKTKFYSDNKPLEDGWFIAGISNRITYHLPLHLWDKIEAPEISCSKYDGHTSKDVAERVLELGKWGAYRFFIEHKKTINEKNTADTVSGDML